MSKQNQKNAIVTEQTAETSSVSEFKEMFGEQSLMLSVIKPLLKDRTTQKYIVFATDTYAENGGYYHKNRQMFPDFVYNIIMSGTLLPRIQKSREQQKSRTKAKAEVFTPSWICNQMNNYCDTEWFGQEGVFNTENADHTWTVNENKIMFPKKSGKVSGWQSYVDSRRIEITCGEAPYLVSRYDATTGELFPIEKRIGILDRKLRVVNENAKNDAEWEKWTERAFQASYGFEYQGDNLFFARVNLMQTYIDYYTARFGKNPSVEKCRNIAKIISWNLWQMDGLKDICPFGIPQDKMVENQDWNQILLIEEEDIPVSDEMVYCRIKDWRANESVEFRSLKTERKEKSQS